MGNYSSLKASIAQVIKTNGNQEITGQLLQNALVGIISSIGSHATFAGVAYPSTNPGVIDQNAFWIAGAPGVYSNFNGLKVEKNSLALFINTGEQWVVKDVLNLNTELDIRHSIFSGEFPFFKEVLDLNLHKFIVDIYVEVDKELEKYKYICPAVISDKSIALFGSNYSQSTSDFKQFASLDIATPLDRNGKLMLMSSDTNNSWAIVDMEYAPGKAVYNLFEHSGMAFDISVINTSKKGTWFKEDYTYQHAIDSSSQLEYEYMYTVDYFKGANIVTQFIGRRGFTGAGFNIGTINTAFKYLITKVFVYSPINRVNVQIREHDKNGRILYDFTTAIKTLYPSGSAQKLSLDLVPHNNFDIQRLLNIDLFVILKFNGEACMMLADRTTKPDTDVNSVYVTSNRLSKYAKLSDIKPYNPNPYIYFRLASGRRLAIEDSLKFYDLSSAAIKQEGALYDVYFDESKLPEEAKEAKALNVWCYEKHLYVSYQKPDYAHVYLLSGKPFSEINNFEKIDIVHNGHTIGFVVYKDKQIALDNSSGSGLLNYKNVTAQLYHNYAIIPESKPNVQPINISLPDKIYAVVGDTLQLFFRGIIQAVDPYRFDILVKCQKGKKYPRYFEYTPSQSDIGQTPFSIEVKGDNGEIINSKQCTLITKKSVKAPTSTIHVACFGDSLTSDGTWCQEAHRRLTKSGGTPGGLSLSNIEFNGSKKVGDTGYFGVGGWTWDSYTTAGRPAFRFQVTGVNTLSVGAVYTNNGHSYTIIEVNVTQNSGNILCSVDNTSNRPQDSGVLTKTSGSGDTTINFTSYSADSQNPLWDGSKVTFKPYADKYCDGKIDVVYTLLSWNGQSSFRTDFSEVINKIKIFANALHEEFPSAKLKILGIQVPSVTGGMGANYGATGYYYADGYGMVVTALNQNKAYQDFANLPEYSTFVEFVNVSSQVDSEYNMPYAETAVNTRNSKTEIIGTNGVHPSMAGYYQIADVVFRNFVANFCQ